MYKNVHIDEYCGYIASKRKRKVKTGKPNYITLILIHVNCSKANNDSTCTHYQYKLSML